MRVAQFNSHEVTAFQSNTAVVIGVAVNPLLALANHSCDGNYGRVWRPGGGATAHVTRPLAQGEEIADCYGSSFAVDGDADNRRSALSRYLFDCACPACSSNWPSAPALPRDIRGLPKTSYLKKQNLDQLEKLAERFWQGQRDLTFLKELVTRGNAVLRRPHALLVASEEALHAALWREEASK
jgi:hypothetical protein